jgi:Methyltransferase domain
MLSDVDYSSSNRRDIQILLSNVHGKCLEIGSGNGGFASDLMSKFPITLYHAYEPSAAHKPEHADPRLTVFPTYFVDNDHIYDFIFLNDVIEHTDDPQKFLIDLSKNVHRDTTLFISIPNFRNIQIIHKLLNGSIKYEPYGIMDKTHLRVFTKKIVSELFESAPFEISSVQLINKHMYIPTPSRVEITFYKLLSKFIHWYVPDYFYLQIFIIAKPRTISDR